MRARLSPAGVAFAAGAATMAVELLVPRLVARHVGTSVAVWTATIAVVLAGLAVGAAAGGRLADRVGARRAQAALGLAAAAAVAAMPWLEASAAGAWRDAPLVARTLLVVGASCFLPALLLGGIAPAAAMEAADANPTARGRALGRIAAAGASGGVLGTLATGWALVPGLPTSTGVVVAAAVVAVAAALRVVGRPSGRAETTAAATASPPRRRRGFDVAPALDRPAPLEPTMPLRVAIPVSALAGAALLVVEVCALRRAATFAGASVAAWTSVLGAVLAGASIGSALGGRAADRRGPRAALGGWLLGASVLAMLAAWSPALFAAAAEQRNAPFVLRMAAGALLAWGPAAVALGAVAPIVARGAVPPGASEGRRLGLLSASGTAGAVAGAIFASPVLLPALGHGGTLAAASLALALAAIARGRRVARPWAVGVATLLACATLPYGAARRVGSLFAVRDDGDAVWMRETAFQSVRVDELADERGRGRRVRRMALDALVHGVVDLDDPTWIGYGYEAVYAAVTDRVAPEGATPRALFLGAGPYAFPRRLLAVRPGSDVTVVEIDPGVTRAAQEAMGLPDPPPMRVVHEDARTFVDRAAAEGSAGPRFDLVFGDAFQSYSVPFHLTTVEFARAVRALLAPGGAYVVNVIDAFDSGAFVGAFRATLARVFARVDVLVLGHDGGAERLRETFVLVASDRAVDLAGLAGTAAFAGGEPRPIEVVSGARLARLTRASGDLVLSDDYAPVENLLVPVAATR